MNFTEDLADVIVRYKESDSVNLFAQLASLKVGEFGNQIEILLKDIGPCGALSFLDHPHCRNSSSEADLAKEGLENYLELIRKKKIANPYKVRSPPIGSSREVIDELEYSIPPKLDRLLELLETSQERSGNLRCVIFAHESCCAIALSSVLQTLSRKLPERFHFLRPGYVLNARISLSEAAQDAIPSLNNADHGDDVSALQDFRSGKLNVLVVPSVLDGGIPPCNLIVQMDESVDLKEHVKCRLQAGTSPSVFAILTSEANVTQMEDGIKVLKIAERIMAHVLEESGTKRDEIGITSNGSPRLSTLQSCPDVPGDSTSSDGRSARNSLERFCKRFGVDESPVREPEITDAHLHDHPPGGADVEESSKLPPVSRSWLQDQDRARLFLAVRVCKRLIESIEVIGSSFTPKRRKPEPDSHALDAVSIEIGESFRGYASTSSIECKRAMSRALETTKRPELPARATIYVFRIRLDAPLDDEHSHKRTFRPEEEDLCFGLLTFFPDCPSNIPEFPIFTRNGRESVHVETISDLILTEHFWSMCTEFHAYVLKKVCRVPHSDYDPSMAPLVVPIRARAIDSALLERVALKQKQSVNIDSVVSRVVDGNEFSFFIREIYTIDGETRLCLEKIPRNSDCSKDDFKDKTKFKTPSDMDTRVNYARSMATCEIEFISASQWSKALTIPICIHRLNRLLVAEKYRQEIVQAGIGNNPERWPPMVKDWPSRVDLSNLKVTSQELNVMREVEGSCGPSPADILIALTPSSAQDVVDSERFEMLGDSFLKMAVTLHLFSKKELKDEGELTAERSRLTSNKRLFQLAVPKRLHEAVESQKFSVTETFRAPGLILSNAEEDRRIHYQKYRCKTCADSVEALIGVYLEKSGPLGAIGFLEYLGLKVGNNGEGDFLSLFNLAYNPVVNDDHHLDKVTLSALCEHLERLQTIIGYTFRNPFYLLEAITHQSYTNNRTTRSNGRLAFLGDALIDYLVSSFIFKNNPDLNPGQMTLVRSAIVCNNNFGQIMIRTRASEYLLHNSELLHRFTARNREELKTETSCESMICENHDGNEELMDMPKTFGDLMESIIGAVFIDSVLDVSRTWDVFRNLITDRVLFETITSPSESPIVTLQKMFPRECEFGKACVQEDKRIKMTLTVGGRSFTAISRNQKIAKLALARKALKEFSKASGKTVS